MLAVLFSAALLCWLFPAARSATVPMDTPSAFLPTQGFYRWERFGDGPGGFRWTNGTGTVALPNPGGSVRLHLRMIGSHSDSTPLQFQTSTFSTTFVVLPAFRTYHLLVPSTSGERLQVTLTSPTIRANRRGIGVALSEATLAGSAMPLRLLPVLLLATVSGYVLLRRAGVSIVGAAGAMLVALGGASFWHATGGWRFGLLGAVLGGLGLAGLVAVALDKRIRQADKKTTTPVFLPISLSRLLFVISVAVAVRLPFLLAPDPVGDLELSARRMGFLYVQGLHGAFDGGGDYVPLRLYILWGFAQLVPLLGGSFSAPLHLATQLLIKLPGLLADLATLVLIAVCVKKIENAELRIEKTFALDRLSRFSILNSQFLIPALYAVAPPVWINVAWWGQVDALLMLPLVAAVLLLERGDGRWSWLCWAAALLIKAQAIVLAPILFVVTVRRYGCRGLLRNAMWAAVLFIAACVPFFLVGEGVNLAQAYLGSVERFPRTSFGAYNLWYLLLDGGDVRDTTFVWEPLSYRQLGLGLIGAATLLVCAALVRRNDSATRVRATATLLLAFFVLPTQIHERYLFLPLAFLALAVATDKRLVVPFLVLVFTATLNILGVLNGFAPGAKAFIASSPLPLIAAATNTAVLVVLLVHLWWFSSVEKMPDDESRIVGTSTTVY